MNKFLMIKSPINPNLENLIFEGEGQDSSRNFKGGVGSMRTILPMWGLGEKNGAKNQNLHLKR